MSRSLPAIEVSRRYEHTPEGWHVFISFTYDGEIRWKQAVSNGGTFTFEERVCNCRAPVPGGDTEQHQPPAPPGEHAGDFTKFWDRACRRFTFHPDWRVTWNACTLYRNVGEITVDFWARDSYNADEWRLQHFSNSMTFGIDFRQYEDETIDRIRDWFHTIARHEVDEWLLVDGERRWDPHAGVGARVLKEYEDA